MDNPEICEACKSPLVDEWHREPSGFVRSPLLQGEEDFKDYHVCHGCSIKALRALGIWTARCGACQDPACEDNEPAPEPSVICTNAERCGREAGYCSACVEALIQDERARCAQLADAQPDTPGRDIATEIRKLQTE